MAVISTTAVTPKAGTNFYHGSGHNHFREGRAILLPSDVAERLIKDGLVDLAGATADTAGLAAPQPAT
jgi:hypothetical protein